eukprot:jgi/Mesvir1/10744/Mv13815-RA.1
MLRILASPSHSRFYQCRAWDSVALPQCGGDLLSRRVYKKSGLPLKRFTGVQRIRCSFTMEVHLSQRHAVPSPNDPMEQARARRLTRHGRRSYRLRDAIAIVGALQMFAVIPYILYYHHFRLPQLAGSKSSDVHASMHHGDALNIAQPHEQPSTPFMPAVSGKKVLFVVAADTGGWNAVQPVLREALNDGYQVLVHLSGASARLHRAGRLGVTDQARIKVLLEPAGGTTAAAGQAALLPPPPQAHDRGSASAQTNQGEVPLQELVAWPHDIMLVAASASVEGTAVSVLALCRSMARVAAGLLEDRPASSLQTLEGIHRACPLRALSLETVADISAPAVPPLVVCVADTMASSLIRSHSPYRGRLAVTGSPQFDAIVRDLEGPPASASGSGGVAGAPPGGRHAALATRTDMRRRLGVTGGDAELVILFAGQTVGADEILRLLLDAIMAMDPPLVPTPHIILALHPRTPADLKAKVERMRAEAPDELFRRVDAAARESFLSSEALIPASDIVISGYSTTNYYAILWGMPGVVFAEVPSILAHLHKEKHIERAPEVVAGAAWAVRTAADFQHVMREVLRASTGHPGGANTSSEGQSVAALQGSVPKDARGAGRDGTGMAHADAGSSAPPLWDPRDASRASPEVKAILASQDRLRAGHDGFASRRAWATLKTAGALRDVL